MAGGVEGGLAGEAFHRLGWLIDHLGAERAAKVRGDIIANTGVGKVVGEDSVVEGGDVVASGTTQFCEESKKKVFYKPYCSDRAVTEDATPLDLHHSSSVVQVNGDASRDITGVTNIEPEDTVEFNTFVVVAWLYIGTCDGCFF